MIDCISYIDRLFDNEKFIEDFDHLLVQSELTKERLYPIKYQDGPLTTSILKSRSPNSIPYTTFKGSIHKYFNYILTGVESNHDDYHSHQIKSTVDYIKTKYSLSFNAPHDQHLVSTEFGFNIHVSCDPTKIISNHIVRVKEMTAGRYESHSGKGRTKIFKFEDFDLKFYDKGRESKIGEYLLRIELKVKHSRAMKKHGLISLDDLHHPDSLHSLYNTLTSYLDDTLIVDSHTLPNRATEQEKELFRVFLSTVLLDEQRTGINKVSRKTIAIRRKRFQNILIKYDLLNFKSEIMRSVDKKFNVLMKGNGINNRVINAQYGKGVTESTHIIGGICYQRRCLLTGIDITLQRKNSKYISAKSLMRLMCSNNRKEMDQFLNVFELVKLRNPHPKDEIELIERIAHAIRCKAARQKRTNGKIIAMVKNT